MLIYEYRRESAHAHRRRVRRMGELIIPRNVEWPMLLAAIAMFIAFLMLTVRWWLG